MPKLNGVLRGNRFETCRSVPQKNTYKGVYQEEFFNKTDAFSERLQQLLILLKEMFNEVAVNSRFVLFKVIIHRGHSQTENSILN